LETSFCILRGSRTIRINGTAHRCGRLLKKDPDRPFGKRRRIGETPNGRNGDASIQNNPGICAQVKSEPLGRPLRALLPFDVYPEAPWAILFCHFMVDARCAFVPPVRRFAHSPIRPYAVTRLGDVFLPASCRSPRNGIAAHFGRLFSSYRNSYIAFRIA
jgi:hypothetical protein